MTRVILLALAVALLIGCSGTEVRSHAVVAHEVQEDILKLQEAIQDGAEQSEIDQRLRMLVDKLDVLIESAENYDDVLDRFNVLYDEFDEVSRLNGQTASEGDTFFGDQGIRIDDRIDDAPVRRSSTSRSGPLERSNTELRDAAERDVSEELASIIARAELAERRQLDTLGDPDEEESDD